ncbi:hypothetical protein GGI02_002660, partial [Coemansia sp. RSA 2322]
SDRLDHGLLALAGADVQCISFIRTCATGLSPVSSSSTTPSTFPISTTTTWVKPYLQPRQAAGRLYLSLT